jgi:hypothetical protein
VKFELGPGLRCDLAVLMESRLLIQAQSGGGKSRTLRRILEQTHGKVQQIVIDPEGEFSTLREKFDYVLAAPTGGDALAHPRTAAMLAERLLELGVSAVVDLYELKPALRIEFVKLFFEALVNAPKQLRHPVIVAIDEAQMFAPEGAKAESAAAVADLAVRGRKRGICMIAAVARLSEFDKAVAAPLQNKLIGMTSLDLDMKRAAQELGFDKAGMLALRDLEKMQFWGFGPALVKAPTLVTIGDHVTTHLRPGARLTAVVPPPTEKIKALLPQLADLPKEAEQRTRTLQDLQRENADLKKRAAALARATPAPVAARADRIEVKVPVLKDRQLQRLEVAVERLVGSLDAHWLTVLIQDQLAPVVREFAAAVKAVKEPAPVQKAKLQTIAKPNLPRTAAPPPQQHQPTDRSVTNGHLPKGERLVLTAIAQHEGGVTREQLTVLTGYKRSTRDTYLQRLGERGVVEIAGDVVRATDAGVEALGVDFAPLPVGSALLEHWRQRLPEGERRILEVLVRAYPDPVGRDAISEATGYARSSRDTYLQRMGSRKLVEREGRGAVRASGMLFDG